MQYDMNNLPDFFSVRNYEQIDYSFEGLENKKCYVFFDNGFSSNVIEPNKRDIRFVWDGFLLFVSPDISLEDIKNGINLHDERLVALQRTHYLEKANSAEVQSYIIDKLVEKVIPYQIMKDKNEVNGYPSSCDLWSTRDTSVLMDAMDCTGNGKAYYFRNADFHYNITFPESNLPAFLYSHQGAIVLKGENSTAIARLIRNDENLQNYLERIIGTEKLYSFLEEKDLLGTSIDHLKNHLK